MSDELNDGARGLINSARRSSRTLEPGRRARVRLGVMGAVGASSAAMAASLTVTKLVVVAAISAAMGSGATLLVVHNVAKPPSGPAPLVRAEHEPTREADPPPPPPPVEVAEPPIPKPAPVVEESPRPRPRAPAVVSVEPTPVVEPPAPEVTEPTTTMLPSAAMLAAELEVLDRALGATREKKWGDAQRILDEHERRFSAAALRVEARAMQVVVWCGLDRTEEARALARELERTDPLNPAVQRLRDTCARALTSPE